MATLCYLSWWLFLLSFGEVLKFLFNPPYRVRRLFIFDLWNRICNSETELRIVYFEVYRSIYSHLMFLTTENQKVATTQLFLFCSRRHNITLCAGRVLGWRGHKQEDNVDVEPSGHVNSTKPFLSCLHFQTRAIFVGTLSSSYKLCFSHYTVLLRSNTSFQAEPKI